MPGTLSRTAAFLVVTTGVTTSGAAFAQQYYSPSQNSAVNRMQLRSQQGTSGFPTPGRTPETAEPDPNVTVQDRPRPEFDPIGVRAGSFFIYPSIQLNELYDDNVYATEHKTDGEFATTVAPRIEALSNWTRNSLTFDAGGELAYYPGKTDLDYQDFYLTNTGRLDINQANSVSESFKVARIHEDPSSPDFSQSGSGKVTKYWNDNLNVAYRHDFARFYVIGGGEFNRFDFENNGGLQENDRDRNQYLVRGRLGYEVSPRLNTFVQATYDVHRYDQTPNQQGFDRNSQGYSVRGGVGIDITSILFGEVSAGYTARNYNDSGLDNFGGFGFAGTLTWNVTPLTTVILQGSRDAYETTVQFKNDTASADVQSTVSIDITHELLRNLLLNANIGYVRDDFEGTDRSDNTLLAGAGVTYLINRNLSVDATYGFDARDTNADNENYTRDIFRVGVTAKL